MKHDGLERTVFLFILSFGNLSSLFQHLATRVIQNPILFVPESIALSQQCWLYPCKAKLIISLNIQGMEGVGDTVLQSVGLEYKVEVDQLGTPFHTHNCMLVEPLKWEKKRTQS